MGWRYRKSFRIAPGLRVNLGRRGVTSVSVGGCGATVNLGKRGVTGTVSLPRSKLAKQAQSSTSASASGYCTRSGDTVKGPFARIFSRRIAGRRRDSGNNCKYQQSHQSG
jgi:hypothetical protein